MVCLIRHRCDSVNSALGSWFSFLLFFELSMRSDRLLLPLTLSFFKNNNNKNKNRNVHFVLCLPLSKVLTLAPIIPLAKSLTGVPNDSALCFSSSEMYTIHILVATSPISGLKQYTGAGHAVQVQIHHAKSVFCRSVTKVNARSNKAKSRFLTQLDCHCG